MNLIKNVSKTTKQINRQIYLKRNKTTRKKWMFCVPIDVEIRRNKFKNFINFDKFHISSDTLLKTEDKFEFFFYFEGFYFSINFFLGIKFVS